MSIRDEEIKRLIKYSQGLGLKVFFKNNSQEGDAAAWSLDGTELYIYNPDKTSKIQIIMSFIHELSHHLFFIHDKNRVLSQSFYNSIVKNDNQIANKKDRKAIYNFEKESSRYWITVYKDTNMRFSLDKLEKQRKYDVWMYEVFYKTGKFPTEREKRLKKRQLNNKS